MTSMAAIKSIPKAPTLKLIDAHIQVNRLYMQRLVLIHTIIYINIYFFLGGGGILCFCLKKKSILCLPKLHYLIKNIVKQLFLLLYYCDA